MNISAVVEIALAVVAALGGGGLIVLGLSSWLGRLWADRLMAEQKHQHDQALEKLRASLREDSDDRLNKLKSDLDIFKEKHLKQHVDKITAYRLGVDIVASMLSALDQHYAGRLPPAKGVQVYDQFNKERMRLYGYMAMLAPQSVIDALDALMDYLLSILNGEAAYQWARVREGILRLMFEIRSDLGVEDPEILYRGTR